MALTLNVTYCAKEPNNPGAAVMLNGVENEDNLRNLGLRFVTDSNGPTKMYLGVLPSKQTKARVGCGWVETGTGGAISEKTVTPADLQVQRSFCADEFEDSVFNEARKAGTDVNDLTGTALETLLRNMITPIVAEDYSRLVWFGDTASVSTDYNPLDGVWKKLFAGVAATDIYRFTVGALDPATPADAVAILKGLERGANRRLRSLPRNRKRFLVTSSIYNGYFDYLVGLGNLESSKTELQNGIETLTYNGIPVIEMPMWDQVIDEDLADANPHRAIYTADENIQVHSDVDNPTSEVAFFYEPVNDKNYLRVRYKLGADYVFGDYTAVAY